jgi:anti-sigma-K factor RskA
MNLQNLHRNDILREKLASEYVLGTLRGGARRRFESWIHDDAALQRTVAEWQERLHPLAEFAPPAAPSAQVWQTIEKRLDLRGTTDNRAAKSFWSGLRKDLAFWRGLGMASTACAAILATMLIVRLPEPAVLPAFFVATLSDDRAQPVMLITGDAKRRQLIVKFVSQQGIQAGKSLELWAVPKEGTPRSLGLVAGNGSIILPLPDDVTPDLTPILAISLEPEGGSPTPNAPSGPIIYKGAWLKV